MKRSKELSTQALATHDQSEETRNDTEVEPPRRWNPTLF